MRRTLVVSWTHLLLWGLALSPMLCGNACAADFRTLYSFGAVAGGLDPTGGLIADEAGKFYGTTTEGGKGTACGTQGCGVVFRLKRDGSEKVLYNFQGGNDGWSPSGRLLADESGNLYGTTEFGGGNTCGIYGQGCGTVFRVSPDGTETVLYAFMGGKNDGATPQAGLIADQVGNLYGTTLAGGGGTCTSVFGDGCGAVFELAPSGTETLLHAFTGGTRDGASPSSALITDQAGNLYGVTDYGGGQGCSGNGCGTVFKLAPDGTETVLHVFTGGRKDGEFPQGALIANQAGNLYGTTVGGGHENRRCGDLRCGTVFRLAPDGTLTLLHAFQAGKYDGQFPAGGLVEDMAGNFYGTTEAGGHGRHIRNGGGCFPYQGCGTIFELAADGAETVLYRLKTTDGRLPVGGLIADKAGNCYGVTELGGGNGCGYGCGTVFKLKP
jgi:uncharacterized repeat protein (TIGR03803 family)